MQYWQKLASVLYLWNLWKSAVQEWYVRMKWPDRLWRTLPLMTWCFRSKLFVGWITWSKWRAPQVFVSWYLDSSFSNQHTILISFKYLCVIGFLANHFSEMIALVVKIYVRSGLSFGAGNFKLYTLSYKKSA